MLDLFLGSVLQLLVSSKPGWLLSPLADNRVLSSRSMSLAYRYPDPWVSDVFRKNILLTLGYMRGMIRTSGSVNWEVVEQPFTWSITLSPEQMISYHSIVFDRYRDALPLTSANFSGAEGFLFDGILFGGGTCHLASLFSWAAKDAGLFVEAPTNHDFMAIPQIPKEQGVSVYSNPNQRGRSVGQNLYITNDQTNPVTFVVTYDGEILTISVQAAETSAS